LADPDETDPLRIGRVRIVELAKSQLHTGADERSRQPARVAQRFDAKQAGKVRLERLITPARAPLVEVGASARQYDLRVYR
jgi:hypothetical protein